MKQPINDSISKAGCYGGWGVFAIFALGACSGGGSPGTGSGPDPGLETGVFVDAPVEGLEFAAYDAGGALLESGVTNSAGEFHYSPGGIVKFSLAQGVLELGTAEGAAVVTPADLVDYAGATVSGRHTALRNLLRFLQSLDADGDPTNGILIPDIPAGTASSLFPDGFDIRRFGVTEETFGSDPGILTLVSAVSALTYLINGSVAALNFDTYIGNVPGYEDPRASWSPLPTVALTKYGVWPSLTLTWSTTDANACTASGSWTGAREPSGQEVVFLNFYDGLSVHFVLTCTGAGGSTSASVRARHPRLPVP